MYLNSTVKFIFKSALCVQYFACTHVCVPHVYSLRRVLWNWSHYRWLGTKPWSLASMVNHWAIWLLFLLISLFGQIRCGCVKSLHEPKVGYKHRNFLKIIFAVFLLIQSYSRIKSQGKKGSKHFSLGKIIKKRLTIAYRGPP